MSGGRQQQYDTPKDKIFSSFDMAFTSSDSPATLDLKTILGRNSVDGYIMNSGLKRLTFQTSADGSSFDSAINLGPGLTFSIRALSIDSIKINWVDNTSYEVMGV